MSVIHVSKAPAAVDHARATFDDLPGPTPHGAPPRRRVVGRPAARIDLDAPVVVIGDGSAARAVVEGLRAREARWVVPCSAALVRGVIPHTSGCRVELAPLGAHPAAAIDAGAVVFAVSADCASTLVPDDHLFAALAAEPLRVTERARVQGLDRMWMLWGADDVEAGRALVEDCVAPRPRVGRRRRPLPVGGCPLTPAQAQTLAARALDPGQPGGARTALLWVDGDVDTATVVEAVDAVFERTEDLRLGLRRCAHGSLVVLGPAGAAATLDLRRLPRIEGEAAVRQHAEAGAARRWAMLPERPSVEATVFALAEGRHAVCLRADPVFVDAAAFGRLAPRLLEAMLDPDAVPHWPASQSRHLADPAAEHAARGFWNEVLADAPIRTAPRVMTADASRTSTLDALLGRRVLERGLRERHGLAALHLAAAALVDAARTGRDHVVLQARIDLAGDGQRDIGCHTVTVPLPVRMRHHGHADALVTHLARRLAAARRHARVEPGLIERAAHAPLSSGPGVSTGVGRRGLRRGALGLVVEPIGSAALDGVHHRLEHDPATGRLRVQTRGAADTVGRRHGAMLLALDALCGDAPVGSILDRLAAQGV